MKIIAFIILLMPFSSFAQTETRIRQDSLPETVHTELHKRYATYTVRSVTKMTDRQQNVTYRVEAQKKSTTIELLYDTNGKLISKVKSKIYTYDGTEKIKPKPTQSNDGHNHQH